MKKYLVLSLIVPSLLMTACNNDEKKEIEKPKTEEVKKEVTTETPTTEEVSAEDRLNDYQLTENHYIATELVESYGIKEGVYEMSISNISQPDINRAKNSGERTKEVVIINRKDGTKEKYNIEDITSQKIEIIEGESIDFDSNFALLNLKPLGTIKDVKNDFKDATIINGYVIGGTQVGEGKYDVYAEYDKAYYDKSYTNRVPALKIMEDGIEREVDLRDTSKDKPKQIEFKGDEIIVKNSSSMKTFIDKAKEDTNTTEE